MDVDSSSSSSSDVEEQLLEKRSQELEQQISDNKYAYDAHVELVDIYNKLADLSSLRLAYLRFHETYPLTPALWITWLNIEIGLANNQEDKAKVLKLFEEATEDYLSVHLWMEYIKFALGSCDITETRNVIEKALLNAGTHTCDGSLLWDALRELELAQLTLHEADSKEFKLQIDKITDVYKRQLSVPLLNIEDTYMEWEEFQQKFKDHINNTDSIKYCYEKAVKSLQKQKPFEDELLKATDDAAIWEVYKNYIKSVDGVPIKISLYERAVEKSCLNPEIWAEYCKFVYTLGEPALSVSKRVLRNVSWSEELWIFRLTVLEKLFKPSEEITKCFEDGLVCLQGGLDLWMAYLGYTKRYHPDRLMKLFDQAEQQLEQIDTTYKVARFHARLCAKHDYNTSKKVWGKIMENYQIRSCAQYWLEYLSLERQFGMVKGRRALFLQALTCCQDWPQLISEEWLSFELEEGTIDEIEKCRAKIKVLLQSKLKTEKKRKPEEYADERPKKIKTNNVKPEKRIIKEATVKNQGPPKDMDPEKSVFISNLSPLITKNDLQPKFSNGIITLATNNKGESRCFGYIQFDTPEEAATALTRDREELNGRPIFISKCKVDKEKEKDTTFKYSTNVENNKLFVRGLPTKYKKEDVQKIFEPFKCTDVRLVLHKSGQSKGLAYIDFENANDAEKALKATDQTKVSDFVITVAISAPPGKNQRAVEPPPTRNSKSRLQLIPTVLKKNMPDAKSEVLAKKSNAEFRDMFFR